MAAEQAESARGHAARPVLDEKVLMSQVGGDMNLLRQLISIFQDDSPAALGRIQKAMDGRDAGALIKTTHAFRGSVSIFAAPAAVKAAVRLETLAREHDLAGAVGAFATLKKEIAQLRKTLAEFGKIKGKKKGGRKSSLPKLTKRAAGKR
jgi:HPt (histidine-containing phosphotransfer) domain-containing protein